MKEATYVFKGNYAKLARLALWFLSGEKNDAICRGWSGIRCFSNGIVQAIDFDCSDETLRVEIVWLREEENPAIDSLMKAYPGTTYLFRITEYPYGPTVTNDRTGDVLGHYAVWAFSEVMKDKTFYCKTERETFDTIEKLLGLENRQITCAEDAQSAIDEAYNIPDYEYEDEGIIFRKFDIAEGVSDCPGE